MAKKRKIRANRVVKSTKRKKKVAKTSQKKFAQTLAERRRDSAAFAIQFMPSGGFGQTD